MEYAIEINNLSKKYHDFTLDKISFSIAKGTVVGLIGENGDGKSTLINSILGIIDANYSSLKYFGKEYKDNEKEINYCRSHCICSICRSLRQQCTVYRICSK